MGRRPTIVRESRLAGLLVVLGLTVVAATATASALPPPGAEVARVQRHLDGALRFLARNDAADPGGVARGLTPATLARRAETAAALRAYRDAAVFPRNRDFPGLAVPYFRDGAGTLCAVGYLVARGGGAEELRLVESVARLTNHARIVELAGAPATGPALGAWLSARGMTVAEAAVIQPSYCQSLADCICAGVDLAPPAIDAVATAQVVDRDDRTVTLVLDSVTGPRAEMYAVGDRVVTPEVDRLRASETAILVYAGGQLSRVLGIDGVGQVACVLSQAPVEGTVAATDLIDALLAPDCVATLAERYPHAEAPMCTPDFPVEEDGGPPDAGSDAGEQPEVPARGCQLSAAAPADTSAALAKLVLGLGLAGLLLRRRLS